MKRQLKWAPLAFVRLVVALAAGILTYLYVGQTLPELLPWLLGGFFLIVIGQWLAARRGLAGANDAVGMLSLAVVFLAGLTSAQLATESRRAGHLSQLHGPVEFYRAVVDENPVVRPATYATTLRVSAVRVKGKWQAAVGGIRVSVPREVGIAAPRYGEVWLVRGQPAPAKAPLNPGEFDYRRYLAYHQIYHQQFIHPDQYRCIEFLPPSYVRAVSLRVAQVLDGVFRRYITARREYALASALILGLKDDIDQETKRAYANTGTTHIMAVSGLQVGLLFGLITWALRRLFGATPGFRYWSAGVGLAVIWSYAFVTGCSASVLRAAVMFSFIIVARVSERQSTMYNTLAVAAFVLLCYDPYLLADVGFQLSFLAVLSIVYLQPRIAGWIDFREWAARRQRPWQPYLVRQMWHTSGWAAEWIWQATALTLAAQVATFPLGLYYFHQFPLSFLLSNLVAVPLSSGALYVGLGLLTITGITHGIGALVPAFASGLEVVPRVIAVLLENIIWAFNEYIFWIGRQLPNALISGIQLTAPQTWLVFGVISLVLVFLAAKRLAWLGLACALLGVFAGSRVWAAHRISTDEELIIYSIPRRSVCGFWQGASADIVTVDSLPLSETERTYRIVPGAIQRAARRVSYHQGWQAAPMPATLQADDGLVLVVWRGLRLAFVTGYLSPARQPWTVDVVILRRNARVRPAELAAVFGKKPPIVFDSSCRSWYVARQDSVLRAAGFRTHDVTAQGAFRQQSRQ
ncbi:ComEC family competence protein [Hymenobacter sp. BT188]|uniref:ComEC/Rec2 family competence protein n=1 Tax=Hymenobacter sp. BT188 TaxID=2763504 RepID=UPI0016510FD7|nr:ComEC/Rec2 family competence protein [Hymenobacter sp. BT188]MBC6607357.1 ComEC family competence protein [Hymenobacter sp. BT188]